MTRLYAAVCYLAFVAAMGYLIAFVDALDVAPKTIDRGGSAGAPIYVGFIVAFFAAPTMTYGHGLFAVTMLVYIAVAIRYEQRDLVDTLGGDYRDYRDYQTRVRALVPLPKRATVNK